MKNISIDIETFSDINLAKCGVYKYAESPAFEILLFGYAVDGGEVQVIDLARGGTIPEDILYALTDETVTKWAFNASFERVCLSRYLLHLGRSVDPFHDHHPLTQECARFLNPAGWKCSMIWSAYLGLPLSLEGVGAVLKLDSQKMKEGKDLIRYFCVPCKPTKANGGRMRNLPLHAPEKWATFKSYNKRDVEVEMVIQQRLYHYPVPEQVWDEYHIDQKINDRGIAIDKELVRQAVAMDAVSRDHLMAALKEKTGLENPNSVMQMRSWLAEQGMKTESLGKKQVQELLKAATEPLRSVLLLRQQLAKSSVKKYQAMEMTRCEDGRAHGIAAHPYCLRPKKRNEICCIGFFGHRSPCPLVVSQGNLAFRCLCSEWGYLLCVSQFDVWRPGRETWYQWAPAPEREDCRTGPWLWWISGRFESHGRPRHGACRRRTAAPSRFLALGESAHRPVLVGRRPLRETGHQDTHPEGNPGHPLPLAEWYAVHPSAKWTPPFLRETENWPE